MFASSSASRVDSSRVGVRRGAPEHVVSAVRAREHDALNDFPVRRRERSQRAPVRHLRSARAILAFVELEQHVRGERVPLDCAGALHVHAIVQFRVLHEQIINR